MKAKKTRLFLNEQEKEQLISLCDLCTELSELEAKAAKWDDQETQRKIEIAEAVEALCYAWGGTTALHWESPQAIVNWHKEFLDGKRELGKAR